MKYRFTAQGSVDLSEAVSSYDSQRRGLGAEFAVEVGIAISRVLESPDTWPEIELGLPKYRLRRFPFALIYRRITVQLVEVVAVFDLRRRPGPWRR